nr:glycosyltransferase family 4 protein [uncultured Roseateles sp.]
MSSGRPLRICFVAPAIYPILARDTTLKFIGGAEVQQTFLARELARRGHDVSVVCLDQGQPDGMVIDGVTVYRTHAPNAGLPGLRFVHPRLTSVWRAMARADADVYYQRACGVLTGFVSAFARRHGRASVFASAHDLDFDAQLPQLRYWRDKKIYSWGVRNASAVVVQTERQRLDCQAMFGLGSTRINSCYGHRGVQATQQGPIVWAASIKAIKQPELFVEVAKACPDYEFKMIGSGSDADMTALRNAAAAVPNLAIMGFVPFALVEQYFDGAAVHINTSVSEGFPNTFMQAWSRGTPTVSFFDPTTRLDGMAVGLVASTLDEMVHQVKALKTDPDLWASQSRASQRFLAEHHSVERAVDAYETLFARLVSHARAATSAA